MSMCLILDNEFCDEHNDGRLSDSEIFGGFLNLASPLLFVSEIILSNFCIKQT